MDPNIQAALAIGPASTDRERTVDITTIGRRSGRPHRMETWFYRADGVVYLSGLPGRRDWFSNLLTTPAFIFHLKNEVQADLPATAVPVTDPVDRRRIFTQFIAELEQRHDPAQLGEATDVDKWVQGSPLVQVVFQDDSH